MSAIEIKTIKWRCDYCERAKIVRGEGERMPKGWTPHGFVNRIVSPGDRLNYSISAIAPGHWCGKCKGEKQK